MIGLVTTCGGKPPIRAALPGDGVVSVMAYVVHRGPGGKESHLEIGGLDDAGSHAWLHAALGPQDEVRVLVARIEEADAAAASHPWPPSGPGCPDGIEVRVNGEVVARRVVDAEDRVALAVVSWSRGAKVDPTPDEYVCLDVGTDFHRDLVLGDEVLVRMS